MGGAAALFPLLAFMACALVLAEHEGQPMTEYLKEGILQGGRRGSTAAGFYDWGEGASSNRAGNDEEDDEDDLLMEPNALNENLILKKQNQRIKELEAQNKELKARNKELEAQNNELRPKAPQSSLDLAHDVGGAGGPPTSGVVAKNAEKHTEEAVKAVKLATWSKVALKLADQVNKDWANSTEGEARCKELLARARKCHECTATHCIHKLKTKDCELADRIEFKKDWIKKRFIQARWENLNWYQQANSYHVPGYPSVLIHRAGLHALSNGYGEKSYLCASWTAVCTRPATLAQAQCRSARLVLGGGQTYKGMAAKWVPAEAMAAHPEIGLRIVLPQFG